MAASIFNGTAVKILKNILKFKDGTTLASSDAANLSGTTSNVQDQIDDVVADVGAIADPISYQGTWNASTNSPALDNTDVGATGHLYQVTVAGSEDFGAGAISFEVGDKVVNNGFVWEKWDMTDAVSSVNSQTGAVVLDTDDIAEGTAQYFTDERAQDAAGAMATSSAKVSLTYNDGSATLTPDIVAGSLVNADINTSAAIARSKTASGTAYRVLANDSNGVMSENAAITASRAVASDANGQLVAATTTATELGYVSGVTSAIQTQIDSKATEKGVVLNYITNFGAEVNTTGYTTYADAAASAPVDGTGGSPTVTWTRNTAGTHMRGDAHFLFTKDAANRQGEGVAYAFSIDDADRSKPLQISVDYQIGTGTYSGGTSSTDSDLTCYIYDVTNSVVIQPAGFKFDGAVSGVNYNLKATFQAASNSTSYRLIFHTATTSASAYTVKFDNLSVSPIVTTSGTAVSDWVSYTTTFSAGWGTITAQSLKWRRVADTMEISGNWSQSTGLAGSIASITLPSGYTIDSNKLVSGANTTAATGTYIGDWKNNANNEFGVLVTATGTAADRVYFGGWATAGGADTQLIPRNGSAFGNGRNWAILIKIPIAGWSSNTVVSSETDTRVVAMFAAKNGGSVTANTTIPTWNTPSDTHGAFNATTGVYTVQVPGWYGVNGHISFIAGDGSLLSIYVNGTIRISGTNTTSTAAKTVNGLLANLKAGDTITMALSASKTVASDDVSTTLSIHRLSGPSQIAATESVNARYYASATSISGSATTISWTTKDFDTHGSMSAGTYTVPVAGKYQINTSLAVSGTFVLNSTSFLTIQKNGADVAANNRYIAATVTNEANQLSDIIQCVAGDTIRVQYLSSGTGPAIVSSNTRNFISITRVGN